jgi:hypothetical protein
MTHLTMDIDPPDPGTPTPSTPPPTTPDTEPPRRNWKGTKRQCARPDCSRVFAVTKFNKRFCSASCRVLDHEQKHGKVRAHITLDPATGKRVLTVVLD